MSLDSKKSDRDASDRTVSADIERRNLLWFWIAVATVAALAAAAYWYRFTVVLRLSPSQDPASWGQFGDYFGGVVNPLVGVFTLLAVLMALRESAKQTSAAAQQALHAAESLQQSRAEHDASVAQQRFFTLLEWVAETERKISDRGITNSIADPLTSEIGSLPSRDRLQDVLNEALSGHVIAYRGFLVVLDMATKAATGAGRTPEEQAELYRLIATRVDSDDRLIIHVLAQLNSLEPEIARRLRNTLPIALHWSHRNLLRDKLSWWGQ
jgi:hypothetical protein